MILIIVLSSLCNNMYVSSSLTTTTTIIIIIITIIIEHDLYIYIYYYIYYINIGFHVQCTYITVSKSCPVKHYIVIFNVLQLVIRSRRFFWPQEGQDTLRRTRISLFLEHWPSRDSEGELQISKAIGINLP